MICSFMARFLPALTGRYGHERTNSGSCRQL
jgi:hypothetical protein